MVESLLRAEISKPSDTNRDMTDLIAIDAVENAGRSAISGGFEARQSGRRDVEAPCLQYHRHDRKTGQTVMRRDLRRFPQPIMGRQRPIA